MIFGLWNLVQLSFHIRVPCVAALPANGLPTLAVCRPESFRLRCDSPFNFYAYYVPVASVGKLERGSDEVDVARGPLPRGRVAPRRRPPAAAQVTVAILTPGLAFRGRPRVEGGIGRVSGPILARARNVRGPPTHRNVDDTHRRLSSQSRDDSESSRFTYPKYIRYRELAPFSFLA